MKANNYRNTLMKADFSQSKYDHFFQPKIPNYPTTIIGKPSRTDTISSVSKRVIRDNLIEMFVALIRKDISLYDLGHPC